MAPEYGYTDAPRGPNSGTTEISPKDVTVAIFCALPCESVAVRCTLDEKYECRLQTAGAPVRYTYTYGKIGDHNVVVARPPRPGKVPIAQMAATISQQFENVRFALMIGIGAGIPSDKRDIKLGDVVVSVPRETRPAVLEYDFGKQTEDGFILKGSLSNPPPILLSADSELEEDEIMEEEPLRTILDEIISRSRKYERPSKGDFVFASKSHHIDLGKDCSGSEVSANRGEVYHTTRLPDKSNEVFGSTDTTPIEKLPQPKVHRGLILSGDLVVKSSEYRGLLRRNYEDALCIEMEAAGIMDEIPCLVIRGISDYADSHKNDEWHFYASAVAAAYGKAILCKIKGYDVKETATFKEQRIFEKVSEAIEAVDQGVRDLKCKVSDNSKEIQKVALSQQEEKKNQILEWLSPTISSRYDTVAEERQPGTSEWILAEPKFTRWSKSSKRSTNILWCKGLPGVGKSTISSVIIDHFEKIKKDTAKEIAVAYFFFDFANKHNLNTRTFTRGLLKQLAFQSPEFPMELGELHRNYAPSGKTDRENQKIETILLETIANFETAYIIVDALDECDQDERWDVLEIIKKLGDAGARVFATSRPHPKDINVLLKGMDMIELSAKEDDIRKYITAELSRGKNRSKTDHMSDKLTKQIIEILPQKSNGMFLLPKFQLQYLLKLPTQYKIEVALKRFLEASTSSDFDSIDVVFDLIWDSINGNMDRKNIAYKTLSWLIVTKQPLRIHDLETALVIEPGMVEITEFHGLPQDTILDICASFIVVNQKTGIVKLAHETVEEYFLKKHGNPAKDILSLTRTCLNYLSFKEFADPRFWEMRGENPEGIPFYCYSVRNWEALVIDCDQEAIEADIIEFLSRDSSRLSYCMARYRIMRTYFFYKTATNESPLHTAARIGHLNAMKHFISTRVDTVHIRDDKRQQPICGAVALCRVEAVKLLIESGSKPQAIFADGNCIMHIAAASGATEVVKYLLEVSADMIDAKNRDWFSPLHASVFYGHEEIVRLLIDAGANSKLLSSFAFGNAAFIALARGFLDIFSLLLERGIIDLKMPLYRGRYQSGTPLHVAVGYSREDFVQIILSHAQPGVDQVISLADSIGNTPLHNAIIRGSLSVVQLLVENGADVNKRNQEGKTALELAKDMRFGLIEQHIRDTIAKNKGGDSSDSNLMLDTSIEQDSSAGITAPNPAEQNTTTEAEIRAAYDILTRRLRMSAPLPRGRMAVLVRKGIASTMAKKILEYSSYWEKQHVERRILHIADWNSFPFPYVHLTISSPFVRRIVFRTLSHDQGCSDYRKYHGTYKSSASWLAVSVLSSDGPRKIKEQFHRLQNNIHAHSDPTEHISIWDTTGANDQDLRRFVSESCLGEALTGTQRINFITDPEIHQSLSTLRVTDRVTIYPKAQTYGWECHLYMAEMWIYSSIWENPFPTPPSRRAESYHHEAENLPKEIDWHYMT